MVRKWGEQVIRSRQYAAGLALVFAFFSFFDMPVGWLSTVIISLVTLQNGPRQGLIVMSWAILPAIAMFCLGHYDVFINIFVLHYIIAWGFATLLRRHNSWENVLQLAAGLGVIAVIMIYYFAPEFQNVLVAQVTAMMKENTPLTVFNFKPAEVANWIKYIGLFGVGLVVVVSILSNFVLVFVARWWQATVVPMVNIQKECHSVRIHYLTSLLLIGLAVALNHHHTALFFNVILVALVPFIFAGLSLLHAYMATKKNSSVILFVFYILLLFLSPYIVLLLSIMGWLDSFFNFRKKFVVDNVVTEE